MGDGWWLGRAWVASIARASSPRVGRRKEGQESLWRRGLRIHALTQVQGQRDRRRQRQRGRGRGAEVTGITATQQRCCPPTHNSSTQPSHSFTLSRPHTHTHTHTRILHTHTHTHSRRSSWRGSTLSCGALGRRRTRAMPSPSPASAPARTPAAAAAALRCPLERLPRTPEPQARKAAQAGGRKGRQAMMERAPPSSPPPCERVSDSVGKRGSGSGSRGDPAAEVCVCVCV